MLLQLVGLACISLAIAQNATVNLLPLPKQYTNGTIPICIADDFKVTVTSPNPPPDLNDAIGRMTSRLWNNRHEYLSVTFGAEFFPDRSRPCTAWLHTLEVSVTGNSSQAIGEAVLEEPEDRMLLEGYNLTLPTKGSATLTSINALGVFRGLSTFEDMWFYLAPQGQNGNTLGRRWSNGEALYAPFAPYTVEDWPTFPWRSFLLDTSRHFFPVAIIHKLLDTMAMVKLTTFHWHITDSQSWPLQLPNYPELEQKAGFSSTRHYSAADVKGIVQYAAERGIDTVMEIDTPGHTASIGLSHPEKMVCLYHTPYHGFCNEPPCGQLAMQDPSVSLWAQGVLADAVRLMSSKYFGTGGDEVKETCYTNDTIASQELAALNWTFTDALNNFTAITHQALLDAGKHPVVWEEMVIGFGNITALAPETVALVWVDSSHAREVADMGYRFVHAPSNYFYLDCGGGEWESNNGGGISWCDPYHSWQAIYSFDPLSNITKGQEKLVLGGQINAWDETIDQTNLEVVAWPRAAVFAELFWTGPGPNGSYPRSSLDATPRMHDMRYRLVDRGVNAEPLQAEWCALRPGACSKTS